METHPPFAVDDQTDEDFFDKLVADDFGTGVPHVEPADIARNFSNLSISDMGVALDDSGDAEFASKEKDHDENTALQPAEACIDAAGSWEGVEPVGPNYNTALSGSFACDKEVEPRGSVEMVTDIVSPSSLAGRSVGSKGTSVKAVQWSSFGDSGGFGSASDFLTENLDSSANNPKDVQWSAFSDSGGFGSTSDFSIENSVTAPLAKDERSSLFAANSVTDLGTYKESSEQQHAQLYGSADDQISNENDSQNWENHYPGWKFDSATGQWYQVDSYDVGTNSQSDSYNLTNGNVQGSFQENVQEAANGFISEQKSEVSYLQQTPKSVVETVAVGSVNTVSSYNPVSEGGSEYPPNMVFDPQYPGWYYDMNTQQWLTLESYNPTVPKMADSIQEQFSEGVNASDGFISKENASLYNEIGHFGQNNIKEQVNQDAQDWSMGNYVQQNMWQPEPANRTVAGFSGVQETVNFHSSTGPTVNYINQHRSFDTLDHLPNHGYNDSKGVTGGFIPSENMYHYNQPKVEQSQQGHLSHSFYGNQNSINYSQEPFQSTSASYSQFPCVRNEGRSSAGRPPHALVTFGFGGKLIVVKDGSSFGSQDNVGGSVSVLSLMEVVKDKIDMSGITTGGSDYFRALCQQTFPGPLVGGNAAAKDVNKWIDEMITYCEPHMPDFRKVELLRLLLSLLKISCQHYGKLRSPYGTDLSLEETDGPESAVTKLFASARKNGAHQRDYGSFAQCMQSLPSEAQIRTTAVEVENLLVSGRRKEALHCAQAGQLWGPALVLAAQLGDKFYVDTVKQMAYRQFTSGSPLRTLCLLIAGQPADVFTTESSTSFSLSGTVNTPQQLTKALANGMLDEWEENLAIITANRTKDDELVIVHLGDCLWKERGEIAAAHTCYLVAEANFESYSDSARLCLIGADHWKCPRTYASPDAIQRTEVYEFSKVLGNSQFILQPFQPYKLIYAYMLAEVGRVSDSLRYCQSSLKLIKNSSRGPEVELWKSLLSTLEERLRTHQQGGYSTNLAPGKLVGKLFTSIDRSIHRMMGAPPSSLPPMPQGSVNGKEGYLITPKVASSQSTMAMTSLMPSPSVEGMNEWPGDSNRKSMHSRSVSEPDFGRRPKQDGDSANGQSKGGPTRFGQLLQKTMGWVSRSRADRQAKLGETNKFYYNEKLKRWVEEGAELPAEEAALPPPPTAQNGMPDYSFASALKSQNVEPEKKPAHSSGIPPISPGPNQFSARSRSGVRSRYVDTFNKSGGAPTSLFQSPAHSVKPLSGAKFFTPTTPTDEQIAYPTGEDVVNGEDCTPATTKPSPVATMQRFPSMNNIASKGRALQNGNGSLSRSRASSWSGGMSGSAEGMVMMKPLDAASPFTPPGISNRQINGDDLHEVEL